MLFAVVIATFLVILERTVLDKIEILLIRKGVLDKTKILLVLRTRQDDIVETVRESATYRILGYASKEPIQIGDPEVSYL